MSDYIQFDQVLEVAVHKILKEVRFISNATWFQEYAVTLIKVRIRNALQGQVIKVG